MLHVYRAMLKLEKRRAPATKQSILLTGRHDTVHCGVQCTMHSVVA